MDLEAPIRSVNKHGSFPEAPISLPVKKRRLVKQPPGDQWGSHYGWALGGPVKQLSGSLTRSTARWTLGILAPVPEREKEGHFGQCGMQRDQQEAPMTQCVINTLAGLIMP